MVESVQATADLQAAAGVRAAAGAQTGPVRPDLLPLRPQALLLTLLGDYVFGNGICLFSGSVIEVLGRLGLSEHATRSTLTRMVHRGLLRRQRHGRRMYFGLTPRSTGILADGQHRIWRTGAVNDDWDGSWTLLSFSLPGAWQRQRHDLRSQLAWAGFGPLQGGLWIAPGRVTVDGIVADLGLVAQVRVFRARAGELTDVGQMIGDAYDLTGIAARYQQFLDRWQPTPGTGAGDPLAARLSLVAQWLQAIRRDPRLPVQHLPPDWPAAPAQLLFHRLESGYREPARAIATTLLQAVPDGTVTGGADA